VFESRLLEALKIAARLGTWVLYEARDARSLEMLVGMLLYRVDDFERLRGRTKNEERRRRYSELVGYWRRAARWVSSLDKEKGPDVVDQILIHIENNPALRSTPYVAADIGHPSLNTRDKAPRRAGRPRTRLVVKERVIPRCDDCGKFTL